VKPGVHSAAAPAPSATSWNSSSARSVHRGADFVTLAKPRLNLMVLVTTTAGLYLGAPDGVAIPVLVHTLIGTALVAGGAAALNQVWERKTDALMRRTRDRPVASGLLRAT